MAAPLDRGPVTPVADAPRRGRWPWLGMIALVACAALVGVIVVQMFQLQRLSTGLQAGGELRVVHMHRQETEYLQLREEWQRALNPALPLDLRDLSLRYEIFVGRVAMLRDQTALRRLAVAASPRLDDTLARVDGFVRQADEVINTSLAPEERRTRLRGLHPALVALGEPLHELALDTTHLASDEHTERTQALSHYTRLTLVLVGSLTLAVLAFVALSLRQMRLLERRHRALHAMAGDLNAARREAEAASRAKSHFLADMSHEIRTPFQGLLGMLSMLRDSGLTPRQVDYLRTATESADHLLAVLNDILDMSQLEAGRLELAPTTVDLRALLTDVEAVMRPQATARQLALHVDAAPAVPERARLDATRVKQVLFNLLSNAIKFSERGSVDLDLRLVRSGTDDVEQLEFAVTDTGMGMDSATLARLFGRFERGERLPHGAPRGNGLGLEISRSLARLMGGDLIATSEPGKGSRFVFSLPLVAAPAMPEPAALPDADHPQLQPLKVLVAEDHPVNRQVLAALLEGMGHHAHFVPGGEEAVAAVQREPFDLVLMDLHMPGLDGIEATRLIRGLPDRGPATVPIVALTADAFTDTRERCLVAGMNSFLSKPVSREKLGALLRQLFGSGAGVSSDAPADAGAPRVEPPLLDTAALIDPAAVARTLQVLPPERFASVLGDFLDQAPQTVARLRKAVRDAQPLELRVHAHATRGAALNLGLAAMAATAEALQNGAAHLPAHEVARLVQRFEDQIGATRFAAEQAGLLHPAEPAASLNPAAAATR